MTLPPVLHRVGQFWRHSSARVGPQESARAETILGPTLAALFFSLPVNDQRHGLDVLETLDRLGEGGDRLLQQAALLHDLGKVGAQFTVVERSLTVFLHATSPRLLSLLLRHRPGFHGRFEIYRNHARLGAAQLRTAGATELAAVVEEHHADHPRLEVTRRLRRADRIN